MTIDLTQLALALLSIIGTIVTTYLIPFLREKYTKEQLEKAVTWGQIAVNAAEQLMKSGVIKPEERKDYAMQVLQSKGIKLDIEQLSDIIEAFVLELPKSITEDDESEDTAG